MPHSGCVEFARDGKPCGDLAELPEVQALLLSFVAELVGAAPVERLFEAFAPTRPFSLVPAWQQRASAFRFAVRPKQAGAAPSGRGGAEDGPRSFGKSAHVYSGLRALIAELRNWLMANPGVQRLDDRAGGSNGTPYARFRVDHLATAELAIERPNFPGTHWNADAYTGVFRLNGDSKASAIQRLVAMDDNGLEVDEVIEPSITLFRTYKGNPSGEKPCFILVGSDSAEGLYCYPV